jgi:hypothetical protein
MTVGYKKNFSKKRVVKKLKRNHFWLRYLITFGLGKVVLLLVFCFSPEIPRWYFCLKLKRFRMQRVLLLL